MNIFSLINNLVVWLSCLGMPSTHESKRVVETPKIQANATLEPYVAEIQMRLRRGDPVAGTSIKIAERANVPRDEVIRFIQQNYARLQ